MMKIKKTGGIILFVVLVIMGCGPSANDKPSSTKPTSTKEEVKAPKQKTTPEKQQKSEPTKLDKFGRSPDHPHYGHNHATGEHGTQKVDSLAEPAKGKPDKFGRLPGNPHYGHNHK